MAGTRINDDKGPLRVIDDRASGGNDPEECVIHRSLETAAVHDNLVIEKENRRFACLFMIDPVVPPLTEGVPEEDAPLDRILPVGIPALPEFMGGRGLERFFFWKAFLDLGRKALLGIRTPFHILLAYF